MYRDSILECDVLLLKFLRCHFVDFTLNLLAIYIEVEDPLQS